MASEQLSLFEFSENKYKIAKPIRLIELFAGIGAQCKALEVLKANFESYKISEWSKESIKAYTYIHHCEEIKNCTDKEIINLQGISRDYNAPMTDEQLDRLKDDEKILLSNCIKISHNLIDISSVKGEDLSIVDTDKYEYVLTYSFPCQDLSLAGKLAGMEENSGTRSSLLWQVCRILKECKNKPQILMMENVPEVIGANNKNSFNKWCKELENMGYANFYQVLNAKDYYIPQNRRRCFMVSILGKENTFAFPIKMKLDYYLLNFLDENVDEKYYLSDEKIKKVENCGGYKNPLKDIEPNRVCSTLATHCGKDSNSMQLVLDNENNICKTLTTKCDCLGVVVDDKPEPVDFRYDEGIRDRVDKNLCPTITTKSSGISSCTLIKYSNLRIRKLTPCECYKLMGFTKTDYERCAEIQSNATIYHQAGDSIVTTCLIAIFGKLLGVDYEKVIKNYVEKEILK